MARFSPRAIRRLCQLALVLSLCATVFGVAVTDTETETDTAEGSTAKRVRPDEEDTSEQTKRKWLDRKRPVHHGPAVRVSRDILHDSRYFVSLTGWHIYVVPDGQKRDDWIARIVIDVRASRAGYELAERVSWGNFKIDIADMIQILWEDGFQSKAEDLVQIRQKFPAQGTDLASGLAQQGGEAPIGQTAQAIRDIRIMAHRPDGRYMVKRGDPEWDILLRTHFFHTARQIAALTSRIVDFVVVSRMPGPRAVAGITAYLAHPEKAEHLPKGWLTDLEIPGTWLDVDDLLSRPDEAAAKPPVGEDVAHRIAAP